MMLLKVCFPFHIGSLIYVVTGLYIFGFFLEIISLFSHWWICFSTETIRNATGTWYLSSISPFSFTLSKAGGLSLVKKQSTLLISEKRKMLRFLATCFLVS